MIRILVFGAIFFAIFSCSGSQAMFEKGQKLEKAQLYKESSTFYLDAIRRDNENIEAKIALNRVGNLVVDKYMEDIQAEYKLQKYKNVVYMYIEAREYLAKLKIAGIDISMQPEILSYFEDAKLKYSDELMSSGKEYLDKENFSQAAKIFFEVVDIYPENKQAKNSLKIAVNTPIYREGNKLINEKRYRQAYYKFDEAGDFKNSKKLKQLSLEKGTLWIYIGNFDKNNFISIDAATIVKANVVNAFKRYKHTFLKVYDDLSEKNIYGKKIVVSAKVNRIDIRKTPLYENTHKGWERYKVVYQDINGNDSLVNKYRKVYYYSYSGEKNINIQLSFKLNKYDDNTSVLEDVVSRKGQDRINYILYAGNPQNLLPGTWQYSNQDSPADYINNSYVEYNRIQSLYNARRQFAPDYELSKNLLKDMSNTIVKKIIRYNENLQL